MSVDPPKSPWNSLEIAKLLASLLTPVLVVVPGFQIDRSFREADAAREQAGRVAQRAQKEIEDGRIQSQARQAAVTNFSHRSSGRARRLARHS